MFAVWDSSEEEEVEDFDGVVPKRSAEEKRTDGWIRRPTFEMLTG